MFFQGDLQAGIAHALQHSKAVICFVFDESEATARWEAQMRDPEISAAIATRAVVLRLRANSQEADYLTPICPITSTPALIMIKNARLLANVQAGVVPYEQLHSNLCSMLDIENESDETPEPDSEEDDFLNRPLSRYLDLPPAPGQMRLPNNAYDALREHTQTLLRRAIAPSDVFHTQLTLLNNIPIFHQEVQRLRSGAPRVLSDYARSRLLRLPAVSLRIPSATGPSPVRSSPPTSSTPAPAPAPAPPPPTAPATSDSAVRTERPSSGRPVDNAPSPQNLAPSDAQRSQRADYIRMQREREQKQREERERIKAQIKADRDERRRLDEMRRQGAMDQTTMDEASASTSRSPCKSTEVRVQVRTFDGSTLRSTFPTSASLSKDVRPWIDGNQPSTSPYNLKVILTPLPNRTIEAAEEEQVLVDLGLVGSCTLVMVPVKGFVNSYAGAAPGGLLNSAVSTGYNLVSGTAGMIVGGVKSALGYNATEPATGGDASSGGPESHAPHGNDNGNARVRTLADQRADSAGRDQQFYNGNQLNFEPKRDDKDDD